MGSVGYIYFFAVANNATMSDFVHMSFRMYMDLSEDKFLKVESLIKGNMHL